MGCCGQQRATLVQNKTTSASTHQSADSLVNIRFTQTSAVMVRGPVTGKHYQFHGTANTQRVDSRDAAALVKSGYFQRA